MRTRRTATATALAVLFSSVVLVGGAADPAVADSSASLPIKSSGDIVVDGVHKRVFISDPASGKVVATDYSGKVVRTIGSLPGVTGLELSTDSGTLYAAVSQAGAIAAIDTATLTETKRYALGKGVEPRYPAMAGGKLWFGFNGPDPAYRGQIGSIDVSSPGAEVTLPSDGANSWYSAPRLASDPGAPDVLAAAQEGSSFVSLAVYDVSSGAPQKVASGPKTTDGTSPAYLNDFDVTPDGKKLIVGGGSPQDAALVFSTADLSLTGSYRTGSWVNAVAVAPDGMLALGSSRFSPDVFVYPSGTTSALRTYAFPDSGGSTTATNDLSESGLAWAPDRSRVFALTTNVYEDVYALRVLTDPTKSATKVTVNAPAKSALGKKLTVTGKVAAKGTFPAGTRATVTRTDVESPKGKALSPVTLKPDGTFSFTDTPTAGGKVTYRVSYAGDASRSAASGSDTVDVPRTAPTLTLNHNKAVYAYGKDVVFTAHLGKTYKNRTVELYVDPYGPDKPKKRVKSAKVNSKGDLSTTVDMTRDTTVTAVFAGDGKYAPKTVTSTAYAQVKVSTSISKQYKTAKIGSTSYAYFHKKTDPLFTTTMSYYPGRKHKLSLEIYYQGKWRDAGSDYFKLGGNGKSAVTLIGPHDTGYRMRVRASYVDGSSGDIVNSTTNGAWKYFYFTK
ncbi:Ig-like domain repeat protein [Streptomyces sp. NPDC038707]|uniref:YncE family protein n=1 Tax=unclassified Streptomyces TaxID=2593676 RepID=UPI0033F44359